MSQYLPVLITQLAHPFRTGKIPGHFFVPQLEIDEKAFCIEMGRSGGLDVVAGFIELFLVILK
jgi:hypothetical protein